MRKRSHTHERILSAAAEVFAEVGFEGARVDYIAAQAKVNKAAIYYHIGDKEALYQAVLKNIIQITADLISRRIASAASPEEKLSIYVRMLIQRADENPHLPRIMMREVAAGGRRFSKAFTDDFKRLIGIISEIMAEGVDRDVVTETAPILVHLMIIGTFAFSKTIRGLITRLVDDGEIDTEGIPDLPDNVVDEIERLVFNAIKKQHPYDPLTNMA